MQHLQNAAFNGGLDRFLTQIQIDAGKFFERGFFFTRNIALIIFGLAMNKYPSILQVGRNYDAAPASFAPAFNGHSLFVHVAAKVCVNNAFAHFLHRRLERCIGDSGLFG